jgi:lipopolysaccharide/colanic/teichoic acid biosynthesis glycosyltransferase
VWTVAAVLGRRWFEAALAAVLLVLCVPMLLCLAAGAAVSLRAWPFFTQVRVGLRGTPFRIVKLRTLPLSTAQCATKYELAMSELPWFCRTIRRLHLDELPQLWLVVTGKMSFVGPRPEMPHLYDSVYGDFARTRTAVRPGCTGLWQIGQHCGLMIYEHPEYDEFYLDHRSLRVDAWIVAKSFWLMLPFARRELIVLTDVPTWALRPRHHAKALQAADAA